MFQTKEIGKKFMDNYLKKVRKDIKFKLQLICFHQVNIVRKCYQGARSLEVIEIDPFFSIYKNVQVYLYKC